MFGRIGAGVVAAVATFFPHVLAAQFGQGPPAITIVSPAHNSTRHAINPKIRIEYDTGTECIDMEGECNPVPSTLVVKINGGSDIASGFTKTEWWAENGTGNAGAHNMVADQWNSVYAKICNGLGLCSEATNQVLIQPGPQQILYITPLNHTLSGLQTCHSVGLAPGLSLACDAVVYAHAIPGYVLLGETRSAGIVYSGNSASGYVTVPFDVQLIWDAAASTVQGWFNGPSVYSSAIHWNGRDWDGGTPGTVRRRMALSFPAENLSGSVRYVGRHVFTLSIQVNTAAGAYGSNASDTVPIFLELDSLTTPIARGWSIQGLSRLYPEAGPTPGGAPGSVHLLLVGSGGAVRYFKNLTSTTYGRPDGELSSLKRLQAGGSVWLRQRIDGTKDYYGWNTTLGFARLDSIVKGGRTTTITYRSTGSGSPATIADPIGKQIRFDYTGSGVGALWRICAPAGSNERCTTFGYGTNQGNTVLTSITDPDGAQTTLTYSATTWPLLASVTPRARLTHSIRWYSTVRRSSGVTFPGGDSLVYRASQLAGFAITGGSVLSPAATQPYAKPWGWVRRPLGQVDSLTVDKFGGLRFLRDFTGVLTNIVRDIHSQPLSLTVASSVLWNYQYNSLGAVTTYATLELDSVRWSYDGGCSAGSYPCLPTQRVESRSGMAPDTLKWTYDAQNNVKTVYRGAFGTTYLDRESYNPSQSEFGRVLYETDPKSHVTRSTYEATWGNLSQRIGGDSTVSYSSPPTLVGVGKDTTNFTYTAQGRLLRRQQGVAGPATEHVYDAIGRDTAVIRLAPGGATITEKRLYDDAARTLITRDGIGNSVTFLYDGHGRMIRRTDAASARDTFSYDANGNLVTWTTRRGDSITYTYDSFERIKTKSVPGSGVWTYGYHYLYGTLDTLKTPGVDVYRTHDVFRRLKSEKTVVNGVTRTVSYEYEQGGALKKIVDPWTGWYTFGWDAATRSRTITNPFGESFTVRYTSDGLVSRILFPVGSDSLTYTTDHRPTTAGAFLSGQGGEVSYTRDSVTRLIKAIAKLEAGANVTQTFGYDGFGRLASEGMSHYYTASETFAFDNADNRTGSPGGYNYGPTSAARGRPTLAGDSFAPGDALTYDAAGNPIWWKNKSTGAYDSLSWDPENRLTRFRRYTSSNVLTHDVNFVYDGFGRRVKKSGTGTGTENRLYVWDRWELLADTDLSGYAVRRYTYHPEGVDFALAFREGTASYWLHRDGQGNVYRVDNSSGVAVTGYRYRAWGDRYVTAVGEGKASPYTYKSRQEDRETGLIYMRHRYYSPRLERFIDEDPIGILGGLNTYAFAQNRPTELADPNGLDPCRLQTTGGAVIVDQSIAAQTLNGVATAHLNGWNGDINDSFRTNEEQADLREQMGSGAAEPGESEHNAGTALDLDHNSRPPNEQQALTEAMNSYGFTQTVSGEQWHFCADVCGTGSDAVRDMAQRAQSAVDAAGGKSGLPACRIDPAAY